MEFKRDYFVGLMKETFESFDSYRKSANYNYIILVEDEPIVWEKDKSPIIFGSKDDAFCELSNWETLRNISIITEWEFIHDFCKTEWEKAIDTDYYDDEKMLNYFMNPLNGHNKDLVRKINRLWMKHKESFRPILIALYDRDIDEITDSYSFHIDKWVNSEEYKKGCETADWSAFNDMCFADMQSNWDDYAYDYLMHIADDGDLECIIKFIWREETMGKI